ncbi:serine acetyltransferase [Vibrio satsumensis]|uniref:serine O-acetyltransferase n=1 Tax=Vibrio satsumensis TaxID=2910245 RepID=UPI003D0A3C05
MRVSERVFNIIFATVDTRVRIYIKLLCFCKVKNYSNLGAIVALRLQRKYGVFISYSTVFDSSLTLKHPASIIIGTGTKIGKNVTIFQNVTLGRSSQSLDEYPEIGDNTVIYAGAVILGGVSVGKNCIVGANAVVTRNVPDNSVAVGVPAKVISK